MHHIFVYILNRPEDPFEGIKGILKNSNALQHHILDVRLADSSYNLIRRVEYSARKHVRFLYYKKIFTVLKNELTMAISACGCDNPRVIYFSDEGVWAEFLRSYLREYRSSSLVTVNIQHGFEHFTRPRYKKMRRLINWLSYRILGFPTFGLGSFGGVGGGVFDIYLTYDEKTADFIRKYTKDIAIPVPTIIKMGLIERYNKARTSSSASTEHLKRVIFALQPQVPGAAVTCNIMEVLDELTFLAKTLVEKFGITMILRLHPGMNKAMTLEFYGRSEISRYAEIDDEPDLARSLSKAGVVMSYDSTVLWEAGLLGLVPVCVWGGCFKSRLEFPHEIIQIKRNHEEELSRIFLPETARKYQKGDQSEMMDWEELVLTMAHKKTDLGHSCR